MSIKITPDARRTEYGLPPETPTNRSRERRPERPTSTSDSSEGGGAPRRGRLPSPLLQCISG